MQGVPREIVARQLGHFRKADPAYAAGVVCEGLWRALPLKGEPPMTRFLAEQLATAHWYSMEPARRDFGYVPKVSMDEGLRRLHEAWASAR